MEDLINWNFSAELVFFFVLCFFAELYIRLPIAQIPHPGHGESFLVSPFSMTADSTNQPINSFFEIVWAG